MAEPSPSGTRVDADHLLRLRHLVTHLPEPGLAASGRPGGFPTRRRGSGLDIRDVRAYADGDDFRHVDAMTTARTGRIHVRTFHDDRDKTALLVADFRAPMLWGTRGRLRSVAAAEALALAGWHVITAGGRVGLMAFGGAGDVLFVAPRTRDRAMAEIAGGLQRMHERALAERAGDTSLDEALERAGRLVPRGSTLFLATALDDPGPGFEDVMRSLRRRLSLEVLLVCDAFERKPPPGTYPFFTAPGHVRHSTVGLLRSALSPDPRPSQLRALGVTVRAVATTATSLDMARMLQHEMQEEMQEETMDER